MLFSEGLSFRQPSCKELSLGEPGIFVQRDTLRHMQGLELLDCVVPTFLPHSSVAWERQDSVDGTPGVEMSFGFFHMRFE